MSSPDLPILDLYVLSLLDRGLSSFYEMQRKGGLSLGASTPALKRLTKAQLATKTDDQTTGQRVRFRFEITATGKRAIRTQLRSRLLPEYLPPDFDAVLRLVDMATHYGYRKSEISELCLRAAQHREQEAAVPRQMNISPRNEKRVIYPFLRALCDAETLTAQASSLRAISAKLLHATPAEMPKARKSRGAVRRGPLPR